ncbi:MAG: hypothetical protein C4548_16675, partial [Desulfobacteraceae bacterium]
MRSDNDAALAAGYCNLVMVPVFHAFLGQRGPHKALQLFAFTLNAIVINFITNPVINLWTSNSAISAFRMVEKFHDQARQFLQ